MHSIIAQVSKKWSRYINKEFVEKVYFKWLEKECKANEWPDENKRKYRISFSIVQRFDCGRRYKIEKGHCRSTHGTVGVYLDLKAPISLYCRNCEPHHFYQNLDDKWQDHQDTNSEEGVSDD